MPRGSPRSARKNSATATPAARSTTRRSFWQASRTRTTNGRREAQRIAALATKQAEWWSAGTVPLLDLQADNDPFHPIERMNELKDELGNRVTVAVIRNASHALLPEQPAAVVEAIVAWVRGL